MATDDGYDPHGREHGHGPPGQGPIEHETSDIDLEGIGKIVIGFGVFMVVLTVGLVGAFWLYDRRTAAEHPAPHPMADYAAPKEAPMFTVPNRLEAAGRAPAGPRMLTSEPMYLQQYRADKAAVLTSYGWVDQSNNVVRVPISRAIELVAARGLPQSIVTAATEAEAPPADAPDAPSPAASATSATPAPDNR